MLSISFLGFYGLKWVCLSQKWFNKMVLPSLEQLRVFQAIAHQGNLTAAAKQLRMPASTLGRRLGELESNLGVELFHRTTRLVRLSGDGEFYLKKFQSLLQELEEVERFLNESQLEPEGQLRITAPVSYGIYVLQPILTDFQKQYPQVQVQLFLKNEYVDLVAEGFDLAIRTGELSDSSLVARRIGAIQYVCVASPEYLAARPCLKNPADLKQGNHQCIGLSTRLKPVTWVLNSPAGDYELAIDPSFAVNDPIYAMEMAKAGAGIAYLPNFIVGCALNKSELTQVLPAWQARDRDMYAVYHNRSLMPLALKELLKRLSPEGQN